MNQITIIGNLGADVEQITTQSNVVYFRLSVATTETWKDKQTSEKKSHTTWHKCMLYGNYQNLAPYLTKGTCVAITGTQRNDVIEYKSNGQAVVFDGKPIKTSYPFIKVSHIELVGGSRSNDQQPATQAGSVAQPAQAQPAQAQAQPAQAQPQASAPSTDDLPF